MHSQDFWEGQPSLALSFHRPLVPILYAADPSQASPNIVQKHSGSNPSLSFAQSCTHTPGICRAGTPCQGPVPNRFRGTRTLPRIIYEEGLQEGHRPPHDGKGATREYRWLGFGLVGAVALISTPCRGTHQRFAPGHGNQVHLIWPTYMALTPALDPYLH